MSIAVNPSSPVFQREGNDIILPRTIKFMDAILGSSLGQVCSLCAL